MLYVIMLIPSSFRETPDTPIRSESALSAIAREALILALFVLIPLPSVLVTLVMKEGEQEKRRKAELENGAEVTGALVQAILVVKKAPWH